MAENPICESLHDCINSTVTQILVRLKIGPGGPKLAAKIVPPPPANNDRYVCAAVTSIVEAHQQTTSARCSE